MTVEGMDWPVRAVMTDTGHTLYVDPRDPRAQAIAERGGFVDVHTRELWRTLLRSAAWDLVVDIGAGYGEMLLEVPATSPQIVAFEPDERLIPYLSRTASGAGLSLTIAELALSDTPGPISPDVRPSAPATTLDVYFLTTRARRACVRLDVGGAESLVLDGAADFVSRLDDVVLMVNVRHQHPLSLAELSRHWRLYMFDLRTKRLVRVSSDAGLVDGLMRADWCHSTDVLLVPRGPEGRRPW